MKREVELLTANAQVATDLVWAMQWLQSLTSNLNKEYGSIHPHPRSLRFLAELAQRRTQSETLDIAAREADL